MYFQRFSLLYRLNSLDLGGLYLSLLFLTLWQEMFLDAPQVGKASGFPFRIVVLKVQGLVR